MTEAEALQVLRDNHVCTTCGSKMVQKAAMEIPKYDTWPQSALRNIWVCLTCQNREARKQAELVEQAKRVLGLSFIKDEPEMSL